MSQTIQISEKSAALLEQQAAAHGLTVEAWVEDLAVEQAKIASAERASAGPARSSLVEYMRELRSRVKPDPQGWSVRDYVERGRR